MTGAALVAALLGVAAPAAAQVYRWTDADGVVHLTTDPARIPPADRDKVDVLEASPRGGDEPSAPDPALRATPGTGILAEAHLNGVALTLLVDTGASRTIVALSALARAGVDLTQGRPVGLTGVGGGVRAVEVVVPRLDVAGAQVGPLRIVAHDVPGLTADGLLGRDVLDQFVLTVDPTRGRATLTR